MVEPYYRIWNISRYIFIKLQKIYRNIENNSQNICTVQKNCLPLQRQTKKIRNKDYPQRIISQRMSTVDEKVDNKKLCNAPYTHRR